jgi:hypothetical protein
MSSSTFRFVHAADLHLDAPFQGIRRASPAVTQTLSQASLTAWDALVQLTIDQNAAFLLVAGDICDGGERGIPAQLRFLSGLQRLSSQGVRTFIVRGSRDPADRWMAIHRWPEGVHCFGTQTAESIAVRTSSGHMATIHGISQSNDRVANRVARFSRGVEPGVHVGLLHGPIRTGDFAMGDYSSVADLQAAGMDYWALGGEHRYRQVSAGNPWIVYAGMLQGRSLKDDETGVKGAVVVNVSDGHITSATHHALDAVRLVRTDVDASALAGAADFRFAATTTAARLRAENAGRAVVAACNVVGRRPGWMAAQLADGLWDHLLEDLRHEQQGGDAHVWWDCLVDSTDARDIRKDDDASNYVHGLVDVFRRAPAGLDRLLADHNVAFGPAMIAGHSTFDSIEVKDLLTAAERVALSLLEPKEP